MPNSEGVLEFLDAVERLLHECERRKDTNDPTVISYMLRRIRSSKSALISIKNGHSLEIPEAQEFHLSDIDDLIVFVNEIESNWIQKKDSVSGLPNHQEHPYLTPMTSDDGNVGRPRFMIDRNRVAELKQIGFSDEMVARILGVSRTTLWRTTIFSDIGRRSG